MKMTHRDALIVVKLYNPKSTKEMKITIKHNQEKAEITGIDNPILIEKDESTTNVLKKASDIIRKRFVEPASKKVWTIVYKKW